MPFLKGHTAWNKGIKENPKSIAKRSEKLKMWWAKSDNREMMSENHKWIKDEKHNRWTGDRVGYPGLHSWISRKLGKPRRCDHCERKDAKRYEWANLSGFYKRTLTDWIRLCRSCHVLFDNKKESWGKNKKIYEERRWSLL